jgi:hypothetical protein
MPAAQVVGYLVNYAVGLNFVAASWQAKHSPFVTTTGGRIQYLPPEISGSALPSDFDCAAAASINPVDVTPTPGAPLLSGFVMLFIQHGIGAQNEKKPTMVFLPTLCPCITASMGRVNSRALDTI